MKNLKYGLIIILMTFVSLSQANAESTCVYNIEGTVSAEYVCETSGNRVICSVGSNNDIYANAKDFKYNISVNNFKSEDGDTCPSSLTIGYTRESVDGVIKHLIHNVSATKNECKSSNCETININREKSTGANLGSTTPDPNSETDFSAYSDYCAYGNKKFYYVCGIKSGKFSCDFDGEYSENYSYGSYKQTLTQKDFEKDGEFYCPSNIKVNAQDIGGFYMVYSATLSGEGDSWNYLESSLSQAPQGGEEPTPTTKPNFDANEFCTGSVLKTFRAAGWILFTLKIVVPLALMIFGVIDFFKAITASKDDEIMKAAKTLAIRAIAGIVIFFVPTVINFLVKFIGGEDVYRGTEFGPCTNCMLNPSDSACEVGDNQ